MNVPELDRDDLDELLEPKFRKQFTKALLTKGHVPDDDKAWLRRQAQTNLWFLVKYILFPDRFQEQRLSSCHKEICDFFVKKNPDVPYSKLDRCKDRLLLFPRGFFKSEINIADAVQWIICYPEITMIIMTATDDLATKFVDTLKNYFICPQDKNGKFIDHTLFHALFPEFTTTKKLAGNDGEFNCPIKQNFTRESTAFASSIYSNNAGYHCELEKNDDVLTEDNTETQTQIDKISNKVANNFNLVNRGGYRETIGTRYGLNDTYGKMMEVNGIDQAYGLITAENGEFKYLCKPCWWVKGSQSYSQPDYSKPINQLELQYLFPVDDGGPSFSELLKKYRDNPQQFASQQLNDPIGASEVKFLPADLKEATVHPDAIPKEGRIIISWDLSYSKKKSSDYTVGAVGLIDKLERLWILAVIRGRYTPSEMAFKIAWAIKLWNPELTVIEKSLGAEFLEPEIARQAMQLNVPLHLYWKPTGNTKGVKHQKEDRISGLEPLLVSQRLFFAADIECLPALYKEFSAFPNGTHDDVPDAISRLMDYVPQSLYKTPDQVRQEVWEQLQEKTLFNLLYRDTDPEPQVQVEEIAPKPEERIHPLTSVRSRMLGGL